MTDSEPIF